MVWYKVFRFKAAIFGQTHHLSFLWMQTLTGVKERASHVLFWVELLLRGWWSLGQRLH